MMKSRFDPAWLEAQYNNRARVSDHEQVLGRWDQASALVRAQPGAVLDVPYGDGPMEALDIYPAAGAGSAAVAPGAAMAPGAPPGSLAPVLVFIHGGYWRSLDKAQHAFLAPAFQAQGAMVVVPNYALCPAVGVEQIVLQLATALVWVWHRAAQYGGDASRIALVGHSAGGHLATMLLSCRWKEIAEEMPVQPISGALSISGLYDLEPLRHTASIQKDLQLSAASVARLSPAFFPRPKGAKLYAAVGLDESEEFLRQNRLIRDVWGPTAVPVCETVPQTNHFTVLNGLADPAHRLHGLALRLLGLR